MAADLISAIKACATQFLDPPIANLGVRGIRTAADRVPALLERVRDPERDLAAIAMLMERAGTGGALFRNLYRDFLTECVESLAGDADVTAVAAARDDFARAAQLWTAVASLVAEAGAAGEQRPLARAAEQLREIADIERNAMTTLRSW